MIVVAYKTEQAGKGIKILESSGASRITARLDKVFSFLLEPQAPSYWDPPFDRCIRVVWELDATVAPILKLLGSVKCRKLKDTHKCYLAPFNIFYMPGKVFTVEHIPTKNRASLYDLQQYFPELDDPGDVEEVQMIGRKLLYELKKMDMEPTKLTSPVAIYEECVLDYLDLPKLQDIPKEVALYAGACMGRSWVEAHQLGYWPEAKDYDIQSAYSSIAKDLPDIRYCRWLESKNYQPNAIFGFAETEMTIYPDVMVHPILFEAEDGSLESRTGTWPRKTQKCEMDLIDKWGIGEYKILNGYWMMPPKHLKGELPKPLKQSTERLLAYKQITGLQSALAKRMCFSEDTQVWTKDGIKQVNNVKIGELVYSINPITGKVGLKPIEAINIYPYSGGMYLIENHRHSYLVTPEHQFYVRAEKSKIYKFISIAEISNMKTNRWYFPNQKAIEGLKQRYISLWPYVADDDIVVIEPNRKELKVRFCQKGDIGDDPEKYEVHCDCKLKIKNAYKSKSHRMAWRYKTNDLLELLGWYLSEGYLIKNGGGGRGSFGIGLTGNENDEEEIVGLLKRMDIQFGLTIRKTHVAFVQIMSKALYRYCLDNCGEYAHGKYIPRWAFRFDSSHLAYLYKTLMLGDGTRPKDYQMMKYTSVSEQLAKDFRQLCIHLGKKSRQVIEGPTGKGKRKVYRVYVYKTRLQSAIKTKGVKTIDYDGLVYGLTVEENHTILAGRNGLFEFVGQSMFSGKFGEQRQNGFGPLFNPVWKAEINTQVSLQVADWLYSQGVGPGNGGKYRYLIHVSVDGVLLTIDLPTKGQWRQSYSGPALSVSSGLLYYANKKPKGLRLEDIMAMLEEHPNKGYYEKQLKRRVTLGDALGDSGKFGDLGQEKTMVTTIDLYRMSHDRVFAKLPQTGGALLKNKYRSKPRRV